MKYLMVSCNDENDDRWSLICEDSGGERTLLAKDVTENVALDKIISSEGIKIDIYSETDFLESFCQGRFAPDQDGSMEDGIKHCSKCGKQTTNLCPLRVWGRNEKNKGKDLKTKPNDFCSKFATEEEVNNE